MYPSYFLEEGITALSNKDASIVMGMIARGDAEHNIAAWFGENQGRVAEVKAGSHGQVAIAGDDELPPKGPPGPKGRRLRAYVMKAIAAIENGNGDEAAKLLKDGLANYDKHEA